jgi:hypothetical protein
MKILDGTGKGYLAKVDENNRLSTDSLTVDESVNATYGGMAYNVNTGTINLTSGNPSALLYMRNDSDSDIIITAFFYLLGTSTGGTGDWAVDVYRNPTAGTLVSAGTDFTAVNRDFGSANELDATIKKGAEGSTLTDGTIVIQSLFPSSGRQTVAVGAIVISSGNSIGFIVDPPSGNTSANVQMAFSCFVRK